MQLYRFELTIQKERRSMNTKKMHWNSMYKQQKNGTYELFRSCELNAQLMLVLVLVQLLLHIAAAPVSSIAQGNARELCWLKPEQDSGQGVFPGSRALMRQ